MNKIYFITTNSYKFQKFTESFQLDQYTVHQLEIEIPEIQAQTNREVANFSAQWAASKTKHTVLKEDIGIYIHALDGFPGVYLSDIEKQIKSEGFLHLLGGVEDRSAHWEYAISYCEPGEDPISFYTHQEGIISHEPLGQSGWFMDKIFIPKGKEKTIAQLLDDDEYIRNNDHYKKLEEYLRSLND